MTDKEVILNFGTHLATRHFWHHQIAEYNIRLVLNSHFKSFLSISSCIYFIQRFKHLLEHLPQFIIVLHDQHGIYRFIILHMVLNHFRHELRIELIETHYSSIFIIYSLSFLFVTKMCCTFLHGYYKLRTNFLRTFHMN
ncbi:hypothetical protein SDC9_168414 [bioreactor metagenome]|uniref:Uncharacterized protein n=1 Tax=bioreactor metagenome TaxID=1076179 RepID=A0A645G331_9ZZZZ